MIGLAHSMATFPRNLFSLQGVYIHASLPSSAPFSRFSHTFFSSAVGILGATVMPHSLFLGSALATQDRISFRAKSNIEELTTLGGKASDESLAAKPVDKVSFFRQFYYDLRESVLGAFRKPPASFYATTATRHSERQNNSFEFIKAHLYHGTVDVIGSLLGFAVVINSMYVFLPCISLIANSMAHLNAGS